MKRKKLVLNTITILSVIVFIATHSALLLAGGFAIYIAVNSLYIAQEDGLLSEFSIPFLSFGKSPVRRLTLHDDNVQMSIGEEFTIQKERFVVVEVADGSSGCDQCALIGKTMCKHMDCTSTPENEMQPVYYKKV